MPDLQTTLNVPDLHTILTIPELHTTLTVPDLHATLASNRYTTLTIPGLHTTLSMPLKPSLGEEDDVGVALNDEVRQFGGLVSAGLGV